MLNRGLYLQIIPSSHPGFENFTLFLIAALIWPTMIIFVLQMDATKLLQFNSNSMGQVRGVRVFHIFIKV